MELGHSLDILNICYFCDFLLLVFASGGKTRKLKIDPIQDGIHLTDDQPLDEVPCLREFEHVKVIDSKNKDYYIVMVGAGETAIFATNKKMIPPEIKQLAGDIAMQTFEPKKQGRKTRPLSVKIATVVAKDVYRASNQFIADLISHEQNENDPDPTDDLNYEEFNATCPCNVPDVTRNKKSYAYCIECQTPVHPECIGGVEDYTCALCTINIEGVNWQAGGENARMTCPVDNSITHFALRASKDPKFKKEISKFAKSDDETVKAFGESVLLATKNESAKSHKTWFTVLKNKRNGLSPDGSWYGGTDERFYDHLNSHLSTFTKEVAIPCKGKCNYTKEITPAQQVGEVTINLTTRPAEFFVSKSLVFANTEIECYHSGCKGKVTFKPIQIEKGTDPLYVVVRNLGALNGPEDFTRLPKQISISGQQFQLGMITMWDKAREHFTSLHLVENQFVYYDGQNKKLKKKFRRVFPSDYNHETIYADHVLYVKMINGKKI